MRALRNETKPTASARTEVQPGIWLDARRAVWFAAERLLAVADLHWGCAASHRARGNLLPVWGDDELESRLRALIADYAPAGMIWLGDVVSIIRGRYFFHHGPWTATAGAQETLWAVAPSRIFSVPPVGSPQSTSAA